MTRQGYLKTSSATALPRLLAGSMLRAVALSISGKGNKNMGNKMCAEYEAGSCPCCYGGIFKRKPSKPSVDDRRDWQNGIVIAAWESGDTYTLNLMRPAMLSRTA